MSSEINKLIEIEKEAEKRIMDAKVRAEEIVKKAREDAQRLLEEAKKITFKDIEGEYRKKIDARVEEIKKEYKDEADRLREVGNERLDAVVKYIVGKVVGEEE